MKTNPLLVAAIAAAFVTGVSADDTEDRIAQLDTDGDGKLSYSEASANQELSARFEEIDVNGDGQLGEDEIDQGPIDDFDEIGDDPLDDEWNRDEEVATDEIGYDNNQPIAGDDPIEDEPQLESAKASSEEEGIDDAGVDIITDESDEEIENNADDVGDDY